MKLKSECSIPITSYQCWKPFFLIKRSPINYKEQSCEAKRAALKKCVGAGDCLAGEQSFFLDFCSLSAIGRNFVSRQSERKDLLFPGFVRLSFKITGLCFRSQECKVMTQRFSKRRRYAENSKISDS